MKAFADAIERDPPSRILREDGGPSPELLAFCDETGCSLDYVFSGDLCTTFRGLYHYRQLSKDSEPAA